MHVEKIKKNNIYLLHGIFVIFFIYQSIGKYKFEYVFLKIWGLFSRKTCVLFSL